MKKKNTFALVIAVMFVSLTQAQANPPPIPPPPPPGLPIDGGIILLFICGLFYGIKKINK